MKKMFAMMVAVLALAVSGSAFAQDDAAAPPATTTETPATDMAATPTATGTDFEQVGMLGVGVLSGLQLAAGATGVPTIVGARYWLPGKKMGVDAGIGLGITGGSTRQEIPGATPINEDTASSTAFVLRAGVPMVLKSYKHVNFEVIPELTLGYRSQTNPFYNPPGTNAGRDVVSGLAFSLGGRVGFETFFGFVGIPQLAMETTIGLAFTYASTSTDVERTGAATQTTSGSSYEFGTHGGPSPWDIFGGSIAARYYFDM